MNKDRIQLSIDILKDTRTKQLPFDYSTWVFGPSLPRRNLTIEDFNHHCGSAACAGGYIAADPRTDLALAHNTGSLSRFSPNYEGSTDHNALAHWLDIEPDDAAAIFIDAQGFFNHTYSEDDITVDHIIKLLEFYLEHEELPDYRELSL